MSTPARIAIIGAGIGGLAAAHRLTLRAAQRGCPLEIVVLEASDRPGGCLATERCEGALLERGPDTMVTHKPAGLALCRELGLGDRLVFQAAGRIDILDGGRLYPLPAGFALAVPTRVRPVLASPLLSWRGKLRAVAEPWVRPRVSKPSPPGAPGGAAGGNEPSDESVASYVRRRFGEELYRRICEPVVGGLFMADTEQLSLAASFPRLADRESAKGKLFPKSPSPATPPGPGSDAAAKPPAPAVTLEGGLGQIVDALVATLPPGSLRTNQSVKMIERRERGFVLKLAEGPSLEAEAVLLALPSSAAARLTESLDPVLAGDLQRIPFASAVTVHLSWPLSAVGTPPDCHGFFVPRTASSTVVAASFVSVKHPERTPEGQVVVRVFLGGALHPDAVDRSDEDLVHESASLLGPLLAVRQPPLWTQVWRQRTAMPQRKVGHPALVARLRARLQDHPGLDFAGGPVGAYGLPDSIAEGEAAAERLVRCLASR